jgi:protein SCO1/2
MVVTLIKLYSMVKKWHWYVGFFVILFGVYFLYFFTQDDFSQSNLPLINNNIQPFSFTNQNGKILTERDIEGKVFVAEFFFTTCKGICPKMNANMRRVFDAYKTDSSFMILSHTCMPETDSVPLLKMYEQRMLNGSLVQNDDGSYKINYDSTLVSPQNTENVKWNFVTGDKSSLYKMARQSYLIDNNKPDSVSNITDQFIHTQFFALVDKQSRVRGVYDGLKEDDIEKMLIDINALLKEKYQSRSLN